MKKKVIAAIGVLALLATIFLGGVQQTSADFCDVNHPDLPPPEECKE